MLPAEMERTDGGREESPFCDARKMLSISRMRPLLEKVPGKRASSARQSGLARRAVRPYLKRKQALLGMQVGSGCDAVMVSCTSCSGLEEDCLPYW